jgi:phosphonate transport system substrate-binding protein
MAGKPRNRASLARRALGVAILGSLAAPGVHAARPATFGLTPVFLDSDITLVRQIEAYLTQRLGQPVTVVKRRTYREVTSLLLAGQLDAAWICGYPFVQHRDALTLVAVPSYRGAPLYQSYLIVGRDRAARSLAELRGDIHAFSDPDSNSGFLVTRAQLVDAGAAPGGFFARAFFTYGHRNVIRAVASGLAQSGSVDGYVWDVMAEIEAPLVAATRIIHRSAPMGFPPIAAARLGDPGLRQAFRSALLAMPEDATGRAILATLRLDGFVTGDDGGDLFTSIAEMWQRTREAG